MMTFEFILRIFVAAVLGGLIGLEREYREKAAGLRTHFLVALGSALFMIISAYGFEGVLKDPNMRLDVSRIAAQVVSGIGFIGAGTIIFQKNAVGMEAFNYVLRRLDRHHESGQEDVKATKENRDE